MNIDKLGGFELFYLVHRRRIPAPLKEQIVASHDLTFVHEGRMDYEIDGVPFTVGPGEAMYCPKGARRMRREGQEMTYYTALNFTFAPEGALPLPCHITNALEEELEYYLKRMIQVYRSNSEYYYARCGALLCLLVCGMVEKNGEQSGNSYVEQIKELICSDLSRRITIRELAERVHLYPTYCSTLFKQKTGKSISEYALEQRLQYASRLLTDGSTTVKAIAEAAGFCDEFYFCRIFKQRMGMTPGEYRCRYQISRNGQSVVVRLKHLPKDQT